jgi:hypothetical protein
MWVHLSALTGSKFDVYNLNFASVWVKSHPVPKETGGQNLLCSCKPLWQWSEDT